MKGIWGCQGLAWDRAISRIDHEGLLKNLEKIFKNLENKFDVTLALPHPGAAASYHTLC